LFMRIGGYMHVYILMTYIHISTEDYSFPFLFKGLAVTAEGFIIFLCFIV